MILSDRSLREAIAGGRIVIEPFDDGMVQPSSIDVRVDRLFRVFRNHTAGVIDVKQDLSALTELVEIGDDGVFMLHPGEFVLGSTLERVAVPDDLVARIEGKALAIDTPLPTPDGWTTIGDIEVGRTVFSRTGRPVRVKDVTGVLVGRPCYEVEFSDGSVIVADELHQWLTTSEHERRRGAPPTIKTTSAIAASLRNGRAANHRLPSTAPLSWPTRDLPAVAPGRSSRGDTALVVRPHHRCRAGRARSIVDIRSVPSVPVRCIEVASTDGIYLAGRSCIPTHNSSLGRLGLLIHSTAGFVDSGFDGHITLELANVASLPITIYPGMKIGQLSFMAMTTAADRPYGKGATGSKYQNQRGPTPSRYFENFR